MRTIESRLSALEKEVGRQIKEQLTAPSAQLDPEITKAQIASIVAYERYQQALMLHGVEAFEAQARASDVILWVVVFVVISGIVFAGVQLWKGLKGPEQLPSAEFEISATNLRITSSIVGTVVLAMSIVFLYLYLKEVYDIKPVDLTPQSTAGGTNRSHGKGLRRRARN